MIRKVGTNGNIFCGERNDFNNYKNCQKIWQ